MAVKPTISRTQPVAPWQGGKRVLAKRLTRLIDAVPCNTYVEPFVGMGGVFLRRTRRSGCEVINDLNRDVSNLFRILQRHYPQFLEVMRFQLTTRAEFERLLKVDPVTLTDLERAARFLYLQRTAFGGKVSGQSFGVSKGRPARFNMTTLEPMLEDVHSRLSGVIIECEPYQEVLRRYDTVDTLFYLDPPYWGCEDDYGKEMFSRSDFDALAIQLSNLKGRFILSINDVPEIRSMFAGFDIEEVKVSYTIGVKADRSPSRRELIIS